MQITEFLFLFAYGNIVREICFGFSLNFVANVKENCLSYNYLIIVYYLMAVRLVEKFY